MNQPLASVCFSAGVAKTLSVIRHVVQVPSSIPTGSGALSLCRPLDIGYHPWNEGNCPRVSRGILSKEKQKRANFLLIKN